MGVYATDSTRDSYSIGNWTEKAALLCGTARSAT